MAEAFGMKSKKKTKDEDYEFPMQIDNEKIKEKRSQVRINKKKYCSVDTEW
jgi:hypothetical protein